MKNNHNHYQNLALQMMDFVMIKNIVMEDNWMVVEEDNWMVVEEDNWMVAGKDNWMVAGKDN